MTKDRKFPTNLRSKEHVFYFMSEGIDHFSGNVWFVNNSDETLTEVHSACGGFFSDDDDTIIMSTAPNPAVFKAVKPQEAVHIDHYDSFSDDGFLIEYAVDITAPSFEKKLFKDSSLNATLLWTPLPQQLYDPDNPDELLSPEKAAADYMKRTGRSLDKKISLNRGDLLMDYAAKRLAPSGVIMEKCCHHDGNVTEYKFSDESGNLLFRTCVFLQACLFVESLRGEKKSQAMNEVFGRKPILEV